MQRKEKIKVFITILKKERKKKTDKKVNKHAQQLRKALHSV